MSLELKQAAKTINELAKQEEDARLALCQAIAAAQELVHKEGLVWRTWAYENLRRADGSRWSQWTLYSYASFGRDPSKLNRVRDKINRHGRNAREALRLVSASPARRQSQEIDIGKEVDFLLSAWRNASPEARRRFLKLIAEKIPA